MPNRTARSTRSFAARSTLLAALLLASWGFASAQIDLRATELFVVPSATDIRNAGDGSNRLFITQITGEVLIVRDGELLETPFIDIGSEISLGSERGLFSIAFSPNYDTDGYFFLFYTDTFGSSTLTRYQVSDDPDIGDPTTADVMVRVTQPLPNHNGGRAVFGPDGMMYVGIGDGGGAGDPEENGQDGRTRLGTILRLDVLQEQAPLLPDDNPFLGDPTVRDDVWALGLRNPWRMSFDSVTGDFYIADVGQNEIEEINFEPAGDPGGHNYGWNLYEGDNCFTDCTGSEPFAFPVHTYDHSDGNCSITGGEVYRGPDYPALDGVYVYGDFCTGMIWGLSRDGQGNWSNELLLDTELNLVSFGTDERGNLYATGSSRVVLLSDGDPVEETGIPLDGTFSGTWVVDGLNDEGFFVTIDERPDGSRFAFIAWYTFEEGNPLWLVGVGEIEEGSDSVEMTMLKVDGLNFLDFSTLPANRTEYGTMRFRSIDCDTLKADFDFPGISSGTLDMLRLTGIQGLSCSAVR